ncbi:hypothetical protein DO628_22570 [Salmonella enterica subsp. salamae]|nr:hypothetical protein [Salmonella enterica subsp. salamae serovar Sofia]EBS4543934.1 hypothetical protein [Salmonella enterica subsp. salamae serovar Sofia]
MLLFLGEKEKKKDTLAQNTIYVVSNREQADELICQQIRLAGIENVLLLRDSLDCCENTSIPEDAKGVVIDINDETDASKVIEKMHFFINRSVWCCFVGNDDRISFSRAFEPHCHGYYNIYYQKSDLIQAVLSCDERQIIRKPVSVSVLGCKGGVGCTAIGYNLAMDIAKTSNIPTVYVQGKYCSFDLDLLAGKEVSRNTVSEHKGLSLLSTDDMSFPDFNDQIYARFNFIIFEQSVVSVGKDITQEIINSSMCIVLVTDRSIPSLRTVSAIIEQIKIIIKTTKVPRRIFVCLNDSRPLTKGALSVEEIEKIIERKIDVHFGFEVTQRKKILQKNITARQKIASMVLGRHTDTGLLALIKSWAKIL